MLSYTRSEDRHGACAGSAIIPDRLDTALATSKAAVRIPTFSQQCLRGLRASGGCEMTIKGDRQLGDLPPSLAGQTSMSLFFRPPPQQDASSLQPLTTIYLSPLSKASHTLAVSGDELVDFLSLQPIIRTGDVLTLPSSQQHDAQAGENKAELVAFRVVMTEPGRMGVFVGRERDQEDEEDAGEEEELEETEVVVGPWVSPDGKGNDDGLIIDSSLDPQHARYPSSESSSSSSDKTIQPFPPSPPLSIEHSSPPTSNSDDDDDDEDFEISSSFLQSALLGPSPFDSASSSAGSSPYPHTPPDPLSFSPSTLSSSSACLDPAPLSSTLRASFPARPLVRQGKRRENCREAGALEKNNVVWVKTKMLGEVGAFDGDWVSTFAFLPVINILALIAAHVEIDRALVSSTA
jgi:hypothetical protein